MAATGCHAVEVLFTGWGEFVQRSGPAGVEIVDTLYGAAETRESIQCYLGM